MMGVNPRELKRMLKRMGIEAEELEATRVTIETKDKQLVVEEPQVIIVRGRNQPTMIYIVGEPREVKPQQPAQPQISDEDVKLVAEQAGVDLETARNALIAANGDIAEAILKLKGS